MYITYFKTEKVQVWRVYLLVTPREMKGVIKMGVVQTHKQKRCSLNFHRAFHNVLSSKGCGPFNFYSVVEPLGLFRIIPKL